METTLEKESTETAKPTMLKPHQWTDGADKVLILRRCNADGSSKNGFIYPKSGPVECPDWNSDPICGGGLHGWPWGWCLGEGQDYSIIDDVWLVIAAKPEDVVGELENGGKCKLKRGEVIHFGSFAAAWALINSGRHRLIDAMAKSVATDAAPIESGSSGFNSTAASSGNYGCVERRLQHGCVERQLRLRICRRQRHACRCCWKRLSREGWRARRVRAPLLDRKGRLAIPLRESRRGRD